MDELQEKVHKHEKHSSNETEEADIIAWQLDLAKIKSGIKRHLLVTLISVFIGLGIASYFAYSTLNTYTAETVLFYEADLPAELPGGYTLSHPSLYTVIDMIKLPSNIQAVKSILGLELSIEDLDHMIEVPLPKSRSDLIRITVQNGNPDFAVDIANTLARVVVKKSHTFYQNQLQTALDNYNSQLQISNQRLAIQNKDIEEFQKEYDFYEFSPQNVSLLSEVASAKANLERASIDYNRILVEYENLRRETDNLPESIALGEGSPLRSRLVALESALASARAQYTPNNPKVKKLELEIEQLIGQMSNSSAVGGSTLQPNVTREQLDLELMRMQGQVRSSQKVKQDLALNLEELEEKLSKLPEHIVIFSKLFQARTQTEEQLRFLAQAVDNTQLLYNVPKGSIEIYQWAEEAKDFQLKILLAFLPIVGAALGLLVGLSLAAVIEVKDDKLRTVKQVSTAFGIPTLAVIPKISHLNKENSIDKTLFFIRNLSEGIEQIIREHQSLRQKRKLTIAITSSVSHEGKSTIAYHLAKYYERINKKVILLELDYRPNPLTQSSVVQKSSNILDFLNGHSSFNDILISGKPDRIRINHYNANMKELVKSDQMAHLWKSVESQYDVMILDCPGVVEDDYAANLVSMADLSLLVINSSDVKKQVVDSTVDELVHLGIKLQGVVLNQVLPLYITDERTRREMKQQRIV